MLTVASLQQSCSALTQFSFRTKAMRIGGDMGPFSAILPKDFLSKLAAFESFIRSDGSQEGIALRRHLGYQGSIELSRSGNAQESRAWNRFNSLLCMYRFMEVAANKKRVSLTPLADMPRTLDAASVDGIEFWTHANNLQTLLSQTRLSVSSYQKKFAKVDGLTDPLLGHLASLARLSGASHALKVMMNFQIAAFHVAFLLNGRESAVVDMRDNHPDIPDNFDKLQSICNIGANLKEDQQIFLRSQFQNTSVVNLRIPLQVALLLSPIFLLAPISLCKKKGRKDDIWRAGMALGNSRPPIIVELESQIWAAVLHIAEEPSAVQDVLSNLFNSPAYVAIQNLKPEDPSICWFNPAPMPQVGLASSTEGSMTAHAAILPTPTASSSSTSFAAVGPAPTVATSSTALPAVAGIILSVLSPTPRPETPSAMVVDAQPSASSSIGLPRDLSPSPLSTAPPSPRGVPIEGSEDPHFVHLDASSEDEEAENQVQVGRILLHVPSTEPSTGEPMDFEDGDKNAGGDAMDVDQHIGPVDKEQNQVASSKDANAMDVDSNNGPTTRAAKKGLQAPSGIYTEAPVKRGYGASKRADKRNHSDSTVDAGRKAKAARTKRAEDVDNESESEAVADKADGGSEAGAEAGTVESAGGESESEGDGADGESEVEDGSESEQEEGSESEEGDGEDGGLVVGPGADGDVKSAKAVEDGSESEQEEGSESEEEEGSESEEGDGEDGGLVVGPGADDDVKPAKSINFADGGRNTKEGLGVETQGVNEAEYLEERGDTSLNPVDVDAYHQLFPVQDARQQVSQEKAILDPILRGIKRVAAGPFQVWDALGQAHELKPRLHHQEEADKLQEFFDHVGNKPKHVVDPKNSIFHVIEHTDMKKMPESRLLEILRHQNIVEYNIPFGSVEFDKRTLAEIIPLDTVISIHDHSFEREDQMSNRIRQGTLKDVLTAVHSPHGKSLSALSLPKNWPEDEKDVRRFATDQVAWKNTTGSVYDKLISMPYSNIYFALVSSGNTMTYIHIDADAFMTHCGVYHGSKLWFAGRDSAGRFANMGALLNSGFDLDSPPASFQMEAILLTPGTRIIMRLNTPHAVFTPSPAICHGGHCFSTSTMQDSLASLVHGFVCHDYITNVSHEKTRVLFRRIMHFYHRGLVLGKVEEDDAEFVHLPHLHVARNRHVDLDHVLDFLSLCIIVMLANALDPRTYLPPQGETKEASRDVKPHIRKLQEASHVNALPVSDRIDTWETRAVCLDALDWFSTCFKVRRRSTGQVVDLVAPYLVQVARFIVRYKHVAEMNSVEAAGGCEKAQLIAELEAALEVYPAAWSLWQESCSDDRWLDEELKDVLSLDITTAPVGTLDAKAVMPFKWQHDSIHLKDRTDYKVTKISLGGSRKAIGKDCGKTKFDVAFEGFITQFSK